MDYELSQEQIEFKKRFREFCEREIAPHASEVDAAASLPIENYRRLAKEGGPARRESRLCLRH